MATSSLLRAGAQSRTLTHSQRRSVPITTNARPALSSLYGRSVVTRRGRTSVCVRADSRNSDSSFAAGFILGGVLFGTLGVLFAPTLSRALLGDDQRLRLPKILGEEQQKDPEATKQDLIEKIAQLNASIDEVAATLKTKDESAAVKAEEAMKIA